MTFSLYCRFCDAHETRLGSDQTPDPSYTCERCTHAYEEGRAELDAHRDAANVLTEELQDAHQARELAERRTARWKALAKRYRGDAADWRAAFEAAAAMHAGALAAHFTGRVIEPASRCPECGGPAWDAEGSKRAPFCSWRCKRSGEGWSASLLSPEGSARVSSSASGFPGRAAPACKERDNMSGNNGMGAAVSGGAEGGTLTTGEPGQPKQAAPGRFQKTACHKLANGTSADPVPEDGRDGSSVQCGRNGTGVQRGAYHRDGWPADRCSNPACEGSKLCESEGCPAMHPNGCSADRTLDGWRCPSHAASRRYPSSRPPVAPRQLDGSNTNDDLNADACEGLAEERRRADQLDGKKLIPFGQALDAARGWARDWLDVYGQPSALWELVLRFAALVAMRPGETRRLDEAHTLRLLEGEPAAMLWRQPSAGAEAYGIAGGALLIGAFGSSCFGRALPEGEVGELEALVRGAIQRVEALQAEAELFRHAAGLIRGDGFSDRWTAGADFRDMAGAPLDGPHPDAYRFSLLGAMRQAWAERGGAGPVPLASLKRLVTLAAPACFTFKAGPAGAEACQDVLRIVNDQRDPRTGTMQTAGRVLELLARAALAADAEAESEVL